jgi:two-component system NarL family response regulator
MSGRKTRVAVICHHELIRIGAQAVFEADYDLEVFNDSTAIVATLKTYKPDVILLCNVDNARTTIVSDLTAISGAAKGIPLVLLSFYGFSRVSEFIEAGAVGYASIKHCTLAELLDIIARAMDGEIAIDGRTASSMFVSKKTPQVTLTDRETEVVAHVAKGLNNNQIAEAMFISSSTVASHLHSACMKLDVSNGSRSHVAAVAVRVGLI